MSRSKCFVFALCLAAACGGDDENIPGGSGADAAPAADADPNAPDAAPTSVAYAIATDYEVTGLLSAIEVPSLEVDTGIAAGVVAADAVVREHGGLLYVVNRFGADNVTIYDPATRQLVQQMSTGPGTNPHDVAVVGDALYVCLFEAGHILKIDRSTSPPTRTMIDISSFEPDGASGDGVPNCDSIYAVGDRLFATLQLLDPSFVPRGPGKVIVIDTTDDTIDTSFDLSTQNPSGPLVAGPNGDLYVSTVVFPDFGDPKGEFVGCIQRIDTGATPSASCFTQNADLGGYASDLDFAGDELWAALTTSTSFDAGALVRIDAAGAVQQTIASEDTLPSDLAICPTGQIVVADQSFGAAGIRVYAADGSELTNAALDVGLPPAFTQGLVCL